MRKQYWAGWMVLCSVGGVSLAAVTACSQGFDGGCRASRTCADPAGGDAAEAPVAAGQAAGGASSPSNEPDPTAEGGVPSPSAGAAANGGDAGDLSAGGAAEEPTAGAGGVAEAPFNPPPTVMAVSPTDQGKNVDPETAIVLTFSEALAPDSVTPENIQVFDGDAVVDGKLEYAGGKVTFTPAVPLSLLATIRVSVTSGVTDADGSALVSPYTSTFMTRDGAWTTIDAATGSMSSLSDSLSLTATGDALLAWAGKDGGGCPTMAAWFRQGALNGPVTPFNNAGADCVSVTAAGNAAGLGAVAWSEPSLGGGDLAQQFRNGAWQAKNATLSSVTSYDHFRVAVSPTGAVTLIVHDAYGGTTAWRTDSAGKWVAKGDVLSTHKAFSPVSVAFDAIGNGLAIWAAETATQVTEILASRFTVASGKWGPATAIPDTHPGANAAARNNAPALAMTSDGNALAVWVQNLGEPGEQINTSFFSSATGWAADTTPIATHLVALGDESPGVAFDGQAFVTAWAAQPINSEDGVCGSAICTYTARFDLDTSKWGSPASVLDAGVTKMPRLASDGREHLLLVWGKSAGGSTHSLVHQRYRAGKWSKVQAVPEGSVTDKNFDTNPLTLSMNPSGMVALAWGNYTNGLATTIRLASFF